VARIEDFGSVRTDGELQTLSTAATEGMAAHPEDPNWKLAWVLIEAYSGRAKGAVDAAEELAKAMPADARAQYALGLCLISSMDSVAMWNQGARAGRARDLWTRALELDPSYTSARISLIEYYRRAPGIAGGSTKKAKELSREMAGIPASAHLGHLFLAEMAGDDKHWDEFDAEIALARELAPNDDAREQIAIAQALTLLNDRKDPQGALDVAAPFASTSGNYRFSFVCGTALRSLGRCEEAIACFRRVIEAVPTAENSRLDLALCLISTGQTAEARRHLEQFLADHPKSDRAKEAKKALKELDKST